MKSTINTCWTKSNEILSHPKIQVTVLPLTLHSIPKKKSWRPMWITSVSLLRVAAKIMCCVLLRGRLREELTAMTVRRERWHMIGWRSCSGNDIYYIWLSYLIFSNLFKYMIIIHRLFLVLVIASFLVSATTAEAQSPPTNNSLTNNEVKEKPIVING